MAHADPNCSVPGSSSEKNINSDIDKYFTDVGSGPNFFEILFGGKKRPRFCGCETRNNKKTRRVQCPVHKHT